MAAADPLKDLLELVRTAAREGVVEGLRMERAAEVEPIAPLLDKRAIAQALRSRWQRWIDCVDRIAFPLFPWAMSGDSICMLYERRWQPAENWRIKRPGLAPISRAVPQRRLGSDCYRVELASVTTRELGANDAAPADWHACPSWS
jgi:hypothetical protein